MDNVYCPTSQITTLKEIAIEEGSVEAFAQWLNTQGIQSISESELALSNRLKQPKSNTSTAKPAQQKVIRRICGSLPGKPLTSKTAQFYLGELYYQDQDWENAANVTKPSFLGHNQLYEKALVKAAIARVNANNWRSLSAGFQLDSIAGVEENKRYAKFSLMQAYYTTARSF